MDLKVVNTKGKETAKKVTLNKEVFGIEPNDHAIYLDVKQHLANKRQGTHQAKERGEIVGSTRKLRKQKGSGAARVGSIKNPLFRGGGRVFGPRPRNYGFKLNKKLKALARKSALSYKVQEESLMVLEDFSFDAPRTKDFAALMTALKMTGKKSLMVLNQEDKNIYLSSRNLEGTEVVTVSELNTYKILNANKLIVCEGAVKELENVLS
ncbi:MAG: large subunit ribosomal protein L4 [Bacteroidia bacterium]|jgi:large subunit ribosomal protein L4